MFRCEGEGLGRDSWTFGPAGVMLAGHSDPVEVFVRHRILGDSFAPATLIGDVLAQDLNYQRNAGPRRYFWLVNEHVQLVYEPFGWNDEWYVDIVDIEVLSHEDTPGYKVTDAYLDLVVEGMGPTYRILDLHQLADAMRSGELTVDAATSALDRVNRFIESYLHRGAPFPPPQIRPWFAADHRYPKLPRTTDRQGESCTIRPART